MNIHNLSFYGEILKNFQNNVFVFSVSTRDLILLIVWCQFLAPTEMSFDGFECICMTFMT